MTASRCHWISSSGCGCNTTSEGVYGIAVLPHYASVDWCEECESEVLWLLE
jgi:hypothetical protein